MWMQITHNIMKHNIFHTYSIFIFVSVHEDDLFLLLFFVLKWDVSSHNISVDFKDGADKWFINAYTNGVDMNNRNMALGMYNA